MLALPFYFKTKFSNLDTMPRALRWTPTVHGDQLATTSLNDFDFVSVSVKCGTFHQLAKCDKMTKFWIIEYVKSKSSRYF